MEGQESKAAKKNRKKRKATDKPSKDEGFEIVEEVTAPAKKRPSPPSDPIADIKRQIEEAKASKDHIKAQELRQKMWVLQDTLVLGRAGPDAPKVDIQKELSIAKQPLSERMTTSESTTSSHDDSIEKKLKKLRKKLKEIDNLKQRREDGEKLESNQVDKIKTESEILDEISILEELAES